MRRESSAVVTLIGETGSRLLGQLARSPNVSVARHAGAEGPGSLAETGLAARIR